MKMNYDEEADALYLRLDDSKVVDSQEVRSGIVLHHNEDEQVVGIEILDLKRRVPTADSFPRFSVDLAPIAFSGETDLPRDPFDVLPPVRHSQAQPVRLRGKERAAARSGIDLMLEFEEGGAALSDFPGLREELSALFGGRPVVLVSPEAMQRKPIEADLQVLHDSG